MISEQLDTVILAEFRLELDGIHGVKHWKRVLENGLRIAETSGADEEIVEYFAYLHDVGRWDNGRDLEHGQRSAEFVRQHRHLIQLGSEDRFDLLVEAIEHHSGGRTDGDPTVQTCWDADRLDLGRIGVYPDPEYLCTEEAKDPEVIEWGYRRSRGE